MWRAAWQIRLQASLTGSPDGARLLAVQVVGTLRSSLHFVSASDPRLTVCTRLPVVALVGQQRHLPRRHTLPLPEPSTSLTHVATIVRPFCAALLLQVPDRKQKGRVLGGAEHPERRMVDAIKQAMQLHPAAADALVKEIKGVIGACCGQAMAMRLCMCWLCGQR